MKNYIEFTNKALIYKSFAYVDTDEYLADSLFINNKLRVKYGKEYKHERSKYIIIFCKIKKADTEKFYASMEKLKNKMLLMGNTDYLDFCEVFIGEYDKEN